MTNPRDLRLRDNSFVSIFVLVNVIARGERMTALLRDFVFPYTEVLFDFTDASSLRNLPDPKYHVPLVLEGYLASTRLRRRTSACKNLLIYVAR